MKRTRSVAIMPGVALVRVENRSAAKSLKKINKAAGCFFCNAPTPAAPEWFVHQKPTTVMDMDVKLVCAVCPMCVDKPVRILRAKRIARRAQGDLDPSLIIGHGTFNVNMTVTKKADGTFETRLNP